MKDWTSKTMLLEGKLKNGLYVFDHTQIDLNKQLQPPLSSSKVPIPAPSILALHVPVLSHSCSSYDLWHDRLGHPSEKVVKVVLTNCKIPLPDLNSHSFCLVCCLGKIHKFPFRLSDTTYTELLQLVHSDLWGPSLILSSSGYRYYINFIDEFSCFTWIFFVKA